MISKRKSFKRILVIIIAFIVSFFIISFTVTKLVYDGIFRRYDCEYHEYDAVSDKFTLNCEELNFFSGENKLSARLYKSRAENAKSALIVLAPGFNSCGENYIFQIDYLLNEGWSVFAFDPTGCCSSEGKSAKGFPQELLDLRSAINFIETSGRFGYNSIALLGHSRGGYSVCSVLASNYDIAAVVSVSGINSAMDGVMSAAKKAVGPAAYGNYGFLWLYQTMLFGADTVNLRADKALAASDVPALIIHGEDDETVPATRYSIYSHKDEIGGDNVEFLLRRDPANDGHTDLLFEDESSANRELMESINSFLEKNIK